MLGETNVGRGVFLGRDVRAGERILEFRGTPIDFEDTLRMGDLECYAFQTGKDEYLDLEPPGRFVNHSCEPNAGIKDGVFLVALKDMKAGEEVRFDYSTCMSEGHWTMECCCGARSCRGLIRDFKWLPRDRKAELVQMDAVPAFIVAEEIEAGRIADIELERAPVRRYGRG
jgi:hypothetical protein